MDPEFKKERVIRRKQNANVQRKIRGNILNFQEVAFATNGLLDFKK